MKKYFNVCVDKYVPDKHFFVERPASINNPKDNAVMFIIKEKKDSLDVFYQVKNCLIFWPAEIEIPDSIGEKNAVVKCENPHTQYCEFYKDNNIYYLPQPEEMVINNGAYISKNAVIGENTIIMPNSYIGGECCIGNNCYIGCGTQIIGEVKIGNNVIIRENVVIGTNSMTTDRELDGAIVSMPQFGSVIIEDDVSIGAGTVISRGAIDATHIHKGAKISISTVICHNTDIGENAILVCDAIMAGSSSIGKNSMLSCNSTVRNAVHIGDNALVGMGAVVTRNINDGDTVVGNPAKSIRKQGM